jgi:hypothetical protein
LNTLAGNSSLTDTVTNRDVLRDKFTCTVSLIFFLSLASCEWINPEEDIPFYVQIDSAEVITDYASEGSSSHRITDIWIGVNDVSAGVYEIPKTFPLLSSGAARLSFSAGIKDNGISATRVIYPFYFPDTLTINFDAASVYPVTPQFRYRDGIQFHLKEDFEAGNIFAFIAGDTNLIRVNTPGSVYEGNYSGQIYLDQNSRGYEGQTAVSYSFNPEVPVYVEMDYRCDQEFEVGLFSVKNLDIVSTYQWNITAKEDWNKIYLNLTSEVDARDADEYRIQIRAIWDSTLATPALIEIDNIKLLSF